MAPIHGKEDPRVTVLMDDLRDGKIPMPDAVKQALIEDLNDIMEINGHPNPVHQLVKRNMLSTARLTILHYKHFDAFASTQLAAFETFVRTHKDGCPVVCESVLEDGVVIRPWEIAIRQYIERLEAETSLTLSLKDGLKARGKTAKWSLAVIAMAVSLMAVLMCYDKVESRLTAHRAATPTQVQGK